MMFLMLAAAVAGMAPPPTYALGGGDAWIETGWQFNCRSDHYRCAQEAFVNRDIVKAVAELQSAARQHDARAMRELGVLQLRGQVVRRDDAGAVGWFYEAALAGDKPSMKLLGWAFEHGIGVAPDQSLAAFWRRRGSTAN